MFVGSVRGCGNGAAGLTIGQGHQQERFPQNSKDRGRHSDNFRILQEIGSQILRFRPPNVHQIRKIGSKSSCKLEENRVLQTAHYRPHPRSACCCCCLLLLLQRSRGNAADARLLADSNRPLHRQMRLFQARLPLFRARTRLLHLSRRVCSR